MSICLYLCSSISLNVLLTAVGLILSHMGYHPEMARLSHLGDGGGGGNICFRGWFLINFGRIRFVLGDFVRQTKHAGTLIFATYNQNEF